MVISLSLPHSHSFSRSRSLSLSSTADAAISLSAFYFYFQLRFLCVQNAAINQITKIFFSSTNDEIYKRDRKNVHPRGTTISIGVHCAGFKWIFLGWHHRTNG